MTLSLQGIRVTRGTTLGHSLVLKKTDININKITLAPEAITSEVERFQSALTQAKKQLQLIKNKIPEDTPAEIALFIDTYLLMMDDATLSDMSMQLIQEQCCNAEWALKQQRDALVKAFDAMDDPYLSTRKDDVNHVVMSIMRILQNQNEVDVIRTMDFNNKIVLTHDISPSELMLMHQKGLTNFATEYGSPLSHTSILAKSLDINFIVGVKNCCQLIKDDEFIILDCTHAVLLADSDQRARDYYRLRKEDDLIYIQNLESLRDAPSVTQDHTLISLQANIEYPEELTAIHRVNADGVGLYRTEYMYMNTSILPDEEEQLNIYLEVLRSLNGKSLTIRTLDIGADKHFDHLYHQYSLNLNNPALGLRSIRLSLKESTLFQTQVRAILRASAEGVIKMMFPLVTNTREIDHILQIITETKAKLQQQGLKFDPDINIGAVIEVPAAAIIANAFAEKLDFLSIGTNDLIQYTLAIDRMDDQVNYLYDPLHPAVLKLIQNVFDAGKNNNIPIAMCGEMASDPKYTRLLLGMGLRSFSMPTSAILEIKKRLGETDINKIKSLVDNILATDDQDGINEMVCQLNEI